MTPRTPTADDIAMLAHLHMTAWQQTYTGLLPEAEIARASAPDRRRSQWAAAIARGDSRIALIDDLGFAQVGPQRDAGLAGQGYSEELWAIYLLRAGQGRGRGISLLRAALGPSPLPFTTLVLDNNHVACAFYARQGARLLSIRDDTVGQTTIRERVYGWEDPRKLLLSGDATSAP
jgi:GNAT superfamily N-acetyltransferase